MPARKGLRTRKPQKKQMPARKIAAGKSSKMKMTPAQIRKHFAKQQAEARAKQAAAGKKEGAKQVMKRAKSALAKFKVNKKKDKGKLIFISARGTRNPQSKKYNTKGYLVYVNKNGKKELVKQNKYGYKATSFPNLKLPSAPKYTESRQKILLARRKKTLSGKTKKPILSGQIVPKNPKHSFASDVVQSFIDQIEEALGKRRGEKKFVLELAIKTKEIPQPILIAIDFDGYEYERQTDDEEKADWLMRVIWREISNTLAAFGFVTSGSANHIRSLGINKGKPQEKWLTKDGQAWERRHKEIVTIEVFEWKIDEVKFHKKK